MKKVNKQVANDKNEVQEKREPKISNPIMKKALEAAGLGKNK